AYTDGNDRIFGDLGNDWLVGGTGNDHLYGGYGNDLLNADDNHDSAAQAVHGQLDPLANNTPDTGPSYEDIAYGGAGRDVLIGNTGGERLIDWVGEFNSYIVPYAPFGAFSISRQLSPGLMEYLYALSQSDGADPTRDVDEGRAASDPRNGEPKGELGLVLQKDPDWKDQTGAPDDPQPGNIPGGSRDVLRGASFNVGTTTTDKDGTLIGFAADSGSWKVQNGRLEISPTALGLDAASVFYVDSYLPTYYEIRAIINAAKPLAGSKSNAYLIFDYVSPTDFKFAGINISTDKIEMGHRTAAGWIVDVQTPARVKPDTDYNLLLSVNGTVATLVIDGAQYFSFAFTPTTDIYCVTHGLNRGMVGLGAQNSSARIDDLAVQILPVEITLTRADDFSDAVDDIQFSVASGSWATAGGILTGAPVAGFDTAFKTIDLKIGANFVYQLQTQVSTSKLAGVVFDYYGPNDYKFAAIDVESQQIVVGHRAKQGLVIDASISTSLNATIVYTLGVSLKGTTVSVSLNGAPVLGYVYNASVVDGQAGMFAKGGSAKFDSFLLKTNDPKVGTGIPVSNPVANSDSFTATEGGSLVITAAQLLANDTDPNGRPITVVSVSQPSNGGLVQNGIGRWIFTPAANFNGTATFNYTIVNDLGGTAIATVSITVRQLYGTTTYTGTGGSIKDAATTTFNLTIADVRTIMGLNVQVAIAHPAISELTVTLISPDGIRVPLAVGAGIATGDLSVMVGKQLNGTWKLEIIDAKKKNLGTLNSWSLIVEWGKPLLADGFADSGSVSGQILGSDDVTRVTQAAIERWFTDGSLGDATMASLQDISFQVLDLPGSMLALTTCEVVYIDIDAAGYGWFVDLTPADDAEFSLEAMDNELLAGPDDAAYGRMDLLTVIMHEIGHVLGMEHTAADSEPLMSETLDAGVRILPVSIDVVVVEDGTAVNNPSPFPFHPGEAQDGVDTGAHYYFITSLPPSDLPAILPHLLYRNVERQGQGEKINNQILSDLPEALESVDIFHYLISGSDSDKRSYGQP
ncbi:MAG: cadherin-like domain-containing protein, partial [Burkholderiaceae bacterium]|nr:cadherin-like domain-containing protein [Burkholderiaceae bacterium]